MTTQRFRCPLCGPVPLSLRSPLQGESSTGKETALERPETWSQGCRGPETPKRTSGTPLTAGQPAGQRAPVGRASPAPGDGVRGALMATSGLTSLTCTSVSVTLPTIPDQNAIPRQVKQSVQGSRALSSCWGQAQKGCSHKDSQPRPQAAPSQPPSSPRRRGQASSLPGRGLRRGDGAVVAPLYLLKSGARW